MAKTIEISASSKVSVSVNNTYYTLQYTETRSINESDNLESEREQLWQDVNTEVDLQVSAVFENNVK